MQGQREGRRPQIVGTAAELAVAVARGDEHEVEVGRAGQPPQRVVAELGIAAEFKHVTVKRPDNLRAPRDLLDRSGEVIDRLEDDLVVEQVVIDDGHHRSRIAEGSLPVPLSVSFRGDRRRVEADPGIAPGCS